MSLKAARGTKRVCQNCGAKFYDLNRAPAVCPICQSTCQMEQRAKAAPGNAQDEDEDEEEIIGGKPPAKVEIVSLDEVQAALLERARQFRDENTHDVDNYDDFKEVVKTSFARVWWAGSDEDEQRVQEETKATLRCFPLEQPEGSGTCFYTGKPANQVAIFARGY